jgi:hypothetical protein
MKKDLILITAHCPTEKKRKILLDLVIGLQLIREDFDLMVVSHTPITFDVQEKVDWAIFDRDNELLKGWIHQNQPWFSPIQGMRIQSIFFGNGNTYLTLHKQLITGYSMARTFGYEKIQCIEYDSFFCDFTEFYENSKSLDDYDAILYTKEDKEGETNLQFGIGNFHAAKISSLPEKIFHFNREEILKDIENNDSRTTEKRTEDLYKMNNNLVLFKKDTLLMQNGNILRLVDFHKGEFEMQWAVPFYNTKTDTVDFVVWNEASDTPATVMVIVNEKDLIIFKDIPKFSWQIKTIEKIENINSITVLINNKIKNHITLTPENRDLFKETNRSYYD